MTDWQRLEKVIQWAGLSTNAFAVGIGLRRSENLYQIKRGKYGISKELAEAIVRKYPAVNRGWLLTGEGNMLSVSRAEGPVPEEGIPYYIDIETALNPDLPPVYRLRVPSFGACDFAISCAGESMAPDIPSGSIVALRKTDPGLLLPGEMYVVATDSYSLLRYVRWADSERSRLSLIPANRGEFDLLEVERHAVKGLYLVKGLIINKV